MWEYRPDCLACVIGDDPAKSAITKVDGCGRAVEADVVYPDGSRAVLVHRVDGWHFSSIYRTDCATATGMYDRW